MAGGKGPAPGRPASPCRLLAGRYELALEPADDLFQRCWDRLTQREVVLHTIGVQGPGDLERFRREGRILIRVNHPNIQDIHDVIVEPGSPWVTFSLVPEEGPTLADVLAGGARLRSLRATRIAADLAWALSLLHRERIAYGDLDPTRIHVRSGGGERETARLCGLDRVRRRNSHHRAGPRDLPGDPRYLAPEQLAGEEATRASDLFALGCIYYEMLAGRSPSAGGTAEETAERARSMDSPEVVPSRFGVPRRVRRVLRDLLRRDPARRPELTATLAARIEAIWETLRRLPWYRP